MRLFFQLLKFVQTVCCMFGIFSINGLQVNNILEIIFNNLLLSNFPKTRKSKMICT